MTADEELLPGEKPEGICEWLPRCERESVGRVSTNTPSGYRLVLRVCATCKVYALDQGYHLEEGR